MSDLALLSLVTFLPLVGALLLIVVLRGDDEAARDNARKFTLLTTIITFLFSLFLLAGFLVSSEIMSEIRVPFTHKVLWARRTEAREATES